MAPLRQAELHPENGASLSAEFIPIRSGISLALSHQRMAVKRRGRRRRSRPSAGGAGRAKPRALTGVGWSGIAFDSADRQDAKLVGAGDTLR